MFVLWGKNITQPNDPLQKMELSQLFLRIARPASELAHQIQQLRALRALDEKQYKLQKTKLPYFTCGLFHPPVRKKENFSAIQIFVADIDHINQKGCNTEELKLKLKEDHFVKSIFISPGGNGLKVVFSLKDYCKDSALFQAFYKIFLLEWGRKHQMQEMIDFRTSDVTRACFFSYDPDIYVNPGARPIVLSEYINEEDEALYSRKWKEYDELALKKGSERENRELGEDILKKISERLEFRKNLPGKEKQFVQPPELERIMPLVTEKLNEYEIVVEHALPISYGKKLRVRAGIYWAELNIFFGKKGYSIVRTTKSGSHDQLGEMVRIILNDLLNQI